MASVLYWGAEDSDIDGVGNAIVDTTSGRFDPYVACGLAVLDPSGGDSLLASFWRSINQFNASLISLSAFVWTNSSNAIVDHGANSAFLLRFLDTNGIPRIVLQCKNPQGGISGPWAVYKVDAAGSYTQIGSTSFTLLEPTTLQKLTFVLDYSVSGSVEIDIGTALIFKITGVDLTTDSVTSLAGFDLGSATTPSGVNSGRTVWSIPIVCDYNNRSLDMVKLTITGAGGTSDWNGASDGSTVDEIVLNDSDGIDSATADQVELFTQTGTLPSGTWGIVGVGLNARASTAPGSNPQHLELVLNIGTTEYLSSTLDPGIALDRVPYFWSTSPATSVEFSSSEIATMQIGAKSKA